MGVAETPTNRWMPVKARAGAAMDGRLVKDLIPSVAVWPVTSTLAVRAMLPVMSTEEVNTAKAVDATLAVPIPPRTARTT